MMADAAIFFFTFNDSLHVVVFAYSSIFQGIKMSIIEKITINHHLDIHNIMLISAQSGPIYKCILSHKYIFAQLLRKCPPLILLNVNSIFNIDSDLKVNCKNVILEYIRPLTSMKQISNNNTWN